MVYLPEIAKYSFLQSVCNSSIHHSFSLSFTESAIPASFHTLQLIPTLSNPFIGCLFWTHVSFKIAAK